MPITDGQPGIPDAWFWSVGARRVGSQPGTFPGPTISATENYVVDLVLLYVMKFDEIA